MNVPVDLSAVSHTLDLAIIRPTKVSDSPMTFFFRAYYPNEEEATMAAQKILAARVDKALSKKMYELQHSYGVLWFLPEDCYVVAVQSQVAFQRQMTKQQILDNNIKGALVAEAYPQPAVQPTYEMPIPLKDRN